MTKDEIIKKVSEDIRYKIFCKEIGGNLSDDLYQEFMIRLLTLTNEQHEKIISIDFYAVRTLMNMMRNKYDPFFKTFKQPIDEFEERHEEKTVEEIDKEKLLMIIEDELNVIEKEYDGKYPYSVRLFRAYQNANYNFRKVQRETGINFTACFETLKQVKKRIKKRVDNDL